MSVSLTGPRDLLRAAHSLRLSTCGAGFLVDDEPACAATTTAIRVLLGARLLERASDRPNGAAYLAPTRAGLNLIQAEL